MANLQIKAKLQILATLNPRHAGPTVTRLFACVWLSLHGYAVLFDPTSGPMGLRFPTAAGQELQTSPVGTDEKTGREHGNTDDETALPASTTPVPNDDSANEAEATDGSTAPKQTSGRAQEALSPQQQMQIDTLIDQLSAPKFSQRESAATALLQIGVPALTSLRKQLKLSNDQEAQIRITELIKQLIDGQVEFQIQDFLAMKAVNFAGWPEIRLILGSDTLATRTLFVEILRSYPTLPPSMQRNFTNRDRSIALESVVEEMQKKRFKQQPTTADAFALVIPHVYPDFVMPDEGEDLVISVLQSNTATKLRKDAQLSPSFRYLLGQWMIQTSLASREDVLFYGMDWDLPQCQILAKNTILNEKRASTDALAYCLQAMARFGNRSDVAAISTLLTDERPVSSPQTTPEGTITNQVSDLAIAAIACIYGVELEDVGFTGVTKDPRRGFQPREIGFPRDAPEKREAAQEMIKAILKASPPVVAPRPGNPQLAPAGN